MEVSPARSRQVALIAAASLVGPSIPGGIVNRKPEEAAAAVIRLAEMFTGWLETGYVKQAAAREAATAPEQPATGEDDDHTRPGAQEK